ncbi:MAG: IS1634 family transposase [Nitriliruptor sp.]|uniref:IS1634 family transposase n=1 Tax=Nitriliruptor sp. TaxID=2448056 RepID=UPI0034A07889
MASIHGKRIGGKTYYYLREVARVDGKPKVVSQRYLGKADDIVAAMDGASTLPERTSHRRFGDVAAVWGFCQQLGVADTVDEVLGARRCDAGASVGTYLALATVNRIVDPCSKRAFAEWWETTAGPRFVRPRLPAGATDHRRFWDAMDTLSGEQLEEIERRLSLAAVELFDLDLSGLVLDMTNFATFIDTANDRAPIAQRGKAKQKRHDLRLVGLALVVTHDGAIPIVSHPYPGNRHDSTQFTGLLDQIVDRWAALGGDPAELTVTYDSGQNSTDNHTHIERLGLGYVTSLPPCDHPQLLAIPADKFEPVDEDRFEGVTAHDTTVDALGVTRRAIITHSASFHQRQARGFDQTLAKARRQLTELQARLARGRTRKTTAGIQTEIDKILAPRWLDRIITVHLTGDTPATRRLTWRTDARARTRLEDEIFGKRILFTNRNNWPVVDVVAAYRTQPDVESSFRQLKDPHVVSFSPMHHWTEQKIKVHTFYCVLALQIAHLMRREAHQAGLNLSVRGLLAELAGIEETVLIYPSTGGRPKARHMLTDMTPTQQRLHNLFDLDRYAPTT